MAGTTATKPAATTAKIPGKSFLDLPPEIRNSIYALALPETLIVRLNDFPQAKNPRCNNNGCVYNGRPPRRTICPRCFWTLRHHLQTKTQQPALVRAHPVIRAEALLLAYKSLRVVIDNVALDLPQRGDVGSEAVVDVCTRWLHGRVGHKLTQNGKGLGVRELVGKVYVGADRKAVADNLARRVFAHEGVEVVALAEAERREVFGGRFRDGYLLMWPEKKYAEKGKAVVWDGEGAR